MPAQIPTLAHLHYTGVHNVAAVGTVFSKSVRYRWQCPLRLRKPCSGTSALPAVIVRYWWGFIPIYMSLNIIMCRYYSHWLVHMYMKHLFLIMTLSAIGNASTCTSLMSFCPFRFQRGILRVHYHFLSHSVIEDIFLDSKQYFNQVITLAINRVSNVSRVCFKLVDEADERSTTLLPMHCVHYYFACVSYKITSLLACLCL